MLGYVNKDLEFEIWIGSIFQVKYEWWWLYMSDRKQHLLITSPLQICSLRDEAEVRKSHDDITGPLCGESTGDRWIPLTKGQ